MSRITRILTAMVAVLAIGAVGASAAQAGSGEITTDIGYCQYTFTSGSVSSPDPTHAGWAHSQNLSNFAPDPSGTCDVDDIDGSIHLHWNDNGTAQAIGSFTVPGLFGGPCTYGGTLNGTFSGGTFTLNPSPQSISKTSGSFFNCPLSSVSVQTPTSLTP